MTTTCHDVRTSPVPGASPVAAATRREVLTLLVAAPVLAACSASTTSGAASGTRAFTDDIGRAVGVPDRPQRVAAFSIYLGGTVLALGAPLIGWTDPPGGVPEYLGRWFDLSPVQSFGLQQSPDIERLAALRPDLVLVQAYQGAASLPDGLDLARVERIAPVVALDTLRPVEEIVDTHLRLLGQAATADVDAQRRDYETALAELRGVLGERWREVTVNAFSITTQAYHPRTPDGSIWSEILDRVGVAWSPLAAGPNVEAISPERVGELNADLLVYPLGGTYAAPGEFPAQQLFDQLPVVRAGQVVELDLEAIAPPCFPAYTSVTRQILARLRAIPGLRTDLV